jgi:hypothetical protein
MRGADDTATPVAAGPGKVNLSVATWVVVGLGMALRVRQWLGDRSFWADEGALWTAISDRGYAALLRPLPVNQSAPVGWLWSQHTVMSVLGTGERAARLLPLLFGCGAVAVAALLARRLLGGPAALVATALVAWSPLLVSYSNEFKQYSSDVFWCTLLLLLGLGAARAEPLVRRRAATLSVVASAAVWFSHAAVLTAAGVLAVLGLLALSGRRWRRLLLLAGAAAAPLASILVEYAVALSGSVDNETLQRFWRTGFPPRRPAAFADWLADSWPRWMDRPLALHPGWLVLALLAVGVAVLAVRDLPGLLVLLAPLGVLLVAAVLRVYPAADRLLLFAVPTVLLLLAAPVDLLTALLDPVRGPRPAARAAVTVLAGLAAAGLVALSAPQVALAGRHAVSPEKEEETRPVLAYVAGHWGPRDVLLFDTSSIPPAIYGPQVGLDRGRVGVVSAPPRVGCVPGRLETELRRRYDRVWLAWGHWFSTLPRDIRDRYRANLATVGRRVDSIREVGAGADLYDLTLPPEDPDRRSPLLVGRFGCLHAREMPTG